MLVEKEKYMKMESKNHQHPHFLLSIHYLITVMGHKMSHRERLRVCTETRSFLLTIAKVCLHTPGWSYDCKAEYIALVGCGMIFIIGDEYHRRGKLS